MMRLFLLPGNIAGDLKKRNRPHRQGAGRLLNTTWIISRTFQEACPQRDHFFTKEAVLGAPAARIHFL